MAKVKTKLPPVHPGEILLEEFMRPLGISANKLARDLCVPSNRIVAIVNATRAISADTALRLARYFNGTPDFWMNLQARYDLQQAEDELSEAITRTVRPRSAA